MACTAAYLAIAGSVASTVLSAALKPSGSSSPGAMPAVPPPITMPIANDQAAADAKKRSIAEQIARRGRASTILTGDTDAGDTGMTASSNALGA